MNIIGNFTAMITPLKKNDAVDFMKLNDLLEFQIKNQSDGIVVLGATGEAHLLDNFEKRKIMQYTTKIVNKRIPIIAGLTATSTEELISEAHARFIDGADALLVCTPSYIKPTQTGLFKHFKKLADESYLPIILYNNPSRTGVNLEFETVKKLSTHPNIIGIKEANTNFSHIIRISSLINKDFALICGNDEFLLPFLSLGATASISVVGNIFPDLFHKIIKNYPTSPTVARDIYHYITPIFDILSLAPNPVAIKFIMNQFNMVKPYFKNPLCQPNKIIKNKIKTALMSLNNCAF